MDYPYISAYSYITKQKSTTGTDSVMWETTISTQPKVDVIIEPIPQIIPCYDTPKDEYSKSVVITLKTKGMDTTWLQTTQVHVVMNYNADTLLYELQPTGFSLPKQVVKTRVSSTGRIDNDIEESPEAFQRYYLYQLMATCQNPKPYMKIDGNNITHFMKNHSITIMVRLRGRRLVKHL